MVNLGYGRQWIDEDDIAAVVETLKGDWLTQGPKVQQFEEEFAEFVGAKYAVAVSSGTAALHIACIASGMSNGDLVITTPLTFAATANAIRMARAEPLFVDVDFDLNISLRRGTYIVPVDFAGLPCDLDTFRASVMIEDACHALGATYKGRKVGSISDMTCFSFHPVKHITTGEGGMVTTNDVAYYGNLRRLRDHGREDGEVAHLGFNYRMSDIHAALGITQLKRLPDMLYRRREIAQKYCQAFNLKFYEHHAYHLFVIQVDNRNEVKRKLDEVGIHCQIHYKPLHLHPFYGGKLGDYPNAEKYYGGCLTIPLFPKMTNEEVEYVIESLRKMTNGAL